MKSDSVNNKLRLTEALKPQSIQNNKQNQAEAAKSPDKLGERSSDAVRTSVDLRLASSERTTGSGRSIDEITALVQSGKYDEETSTLKVASAVAADLLS
ncbi:hypothetical protein MRY87_07120 [bacterium]|nr:hypothetical protein [bacterium]